MTYWPQLLNDFTSHIYDGDKLVQIDPSKIVEEWNGHAVNVVFIGNYHNSGTITEQTQQLISSCIKVTNMEGRAVFLAEGLKVGIENFGHPLAPKGVRVVGSDCRRSASDAHGLDLDYIEKSHNLEKLIVDANSECYNDIRDWCSTHVKVTAVHTLVFQKLADFKKLGTIMNGWSKQDDTLYLRAKGLLPPTPDLQIDSAADVDSNSDSEWEDVDSIFDWEEEFERSNTCLADQIENYHTDSGLVFVPWGVRHFAKSNSLYEELQAKNIKPLTLLPKNKRDYQIEHARLKEILGWDPLVIKLSGFIEKESLNVSQQIPLWMAFMLSKVLGNINGSTNPGLDLFS